MIHLKNCIVLLIVLTMPTLAMVELSALKDEYTQFEPVTLTIELYGEIHSNDYFGALNDMGSFYELEIQYENEASYIFRSPIRGEGSETDVIDSVFYSTIIKSGGNIVTDKPGYYRFQLKYKHGDRYVSNPLIIYVTEPEGSEEISQLVKIKKYKKAYAQYIILEGGEHNSQGHALFKSLAEKRGAYGRLANGYLALNYSQDFLDLKGKGKNQRMKNFDIADRYLSQIEGSSIESIVTMKAVRNFLMNGREKVMNTNIKKRLARIHSKVGKSKTRKSRLYKKLFK